MSNEAIESTYRLVMPKQTRDALHEALKRYNAFLKGDFQYLLTMRSLNVEGHRLDKTAIKSSLHPRLFDLAGAVFGPARKIMWPEAAKIIDLLNSVRGKVFKSATGVVELTGQECRLIQDISEFYARLHVGQLTYALERLRGISKGFWLERRMDIDDFEKDWKKAMFGIDRNTSLGVGSRQATHLKDILWGLHEVIRHRLAWDAHPEGGMTVDFGTPLNAYAPVPMTTIERIHKPC